MINIAKLSVTPAQRSTLLGFVLEYVSVTITFTEEKKTKVKTFCTAMQHKHETTYHRASPISWHTCR